MKVIFDTNPQASLNYDLATRDSQLLPLEPRLQQRLQHSLTLFQGGYDSSLVVATRVGDLCFISSEGIRKCSTGLEPSLSRGREKSGPSKACPTLFVPCFSQESIPGSMNVWPVIGHCMAGQWQPMVSLATGYRWLNVTWKVPCHRLPDNSPSAKQNTMIYMYVLAKQKRWPTKLDYKMPRTCPATVCQAEYHDRNVLV